MLHMILYMLVIEAAIIFMQIITKTESNFVLNIVIYVCSIY